MLQAISLAQTAALLKEVPVGAVIVKQDKIIASGFNLRENSQIVSKHAEIIAIENACSYLNSWRLIDCTLYVTLEPCLMCAGAIYQSRIKKVVFGAYDKKAGAMGSLYNIHADPRLNHNCEIEAGVEEEQCKNLIKNFFLQRRRKNISTE